LQVADNNIALREYERRRHERQETRARCTRLHGRIANARIGVFLIAAGLAWLTFWSQRTSGLWLGLSLAVFLILVFWHERVRQARKRAESAVAFFDKALARIRNEWAGTGEPGTRFLDESHPNAVDLDLFGRGSLFELLCTARTRQGEDTLADWLRAPASAEVVYARQKAVEELRSRLDLREDIALLASDVPRGVTFDALIGWGKLAGIPISPSARASAIVVAAASVGLLIAWGGFGVSWYFLLPVLLLEGSFALWLSKRVRVVLGPVERRAADLSLFLELLGRFEREPFESSRLCQLRAELDAAGLRPSRQIARLVRFIEWLNAQNNLIFAPLAPFLLWNTQFALAIEAWRVRSGPAIGRWLSAIGELEALCALATYAYENPVDPFPEIVTAGICFEAEALGHPLIPRDRCVTNDVRLSKEPQLWIVSGSNMSGKSTLLRTIGVNTVLALAGGPVRARRLRITSVVVGATLRVQDSLQAGRSRFFAEITRLHQLLDLAKESPPLLFLLDELLQGTNSHDRRIGAEAVVCNLLDRGAIGLLTTHDLALTQIGELLSPRAANVHFEDQLQDGQMSFDYRIHPGVVQHNNALALMRAVGIDV
jgi:hypothetical protein